MTRNHLPKYTRIDVREKRPGGFGRVTCAVAIFTMVGRDMRVKKYNGAGKRKERKEMEEYKEGEYVIQ